MAPRTRLPGTLDPSRDESAAGSLPVARVLPGRTGPPGPPGPEGPAGPGGGITVEDVDDRVAALLTAGSNITLTYNDVSNTLTIAATATSGLTAEEVDDRVAALLTAGSNVTITYDDTANTLTIASTGGGGGLTAEDVDDRVAALLQAGSNVTLTYNDVSNTLTIASATGLTSEEVDDRVAALLTAGSNVTLTYNDISNTLTIAAASGLTAEDVDDRVAALLVAGTNVTLNYNDAANTLTINSSASGGLTSEDVDDRVATLLQAGSNVTLTYNDVANTLTVAAAAGAGVNASTEPMINGKLVASVAGNALTVAVKTWAGADPSGGDPVSVVFRRPDGTSVLRTLTSALSVVTAAGTLLNTVGGVPFRLWVHMLDTSGTLSLFLTNASPSGSLVTVNDHINTAIVSRVLGYMDWNTGLPTAGQWTAAPTNIMAFGPGVKLPGEVIQARSATCTDYLNVTSTSPTNVPGLSVTMQAASPCNRFTCALWGSLGTNTGASGSSFAAVGIRRGGALISGSEALVGHVAVNNITTGGAFAIFGTDAPGVTSAQTWTGTLRSTTAGPASFVNPGGILSITEIMG
jgi:ribulose bisphosphate carboxylase small subunit